jgi:diadenylate cyclase
VLRDLLEMTHLDQFGWMDLLDILLLAVIIYYMLLLIRGTRAAQMLVGVLVMAVAFWASGLPGGVHLRTVHRVLGSFLFYVPFALIVIFQDTIRRAVAGLARNPLRLLHPHLTDWMIRDIARAADMLAQRRHGALIVLARQQGLREQVETGVTIDAMVSGDLLVNLFAPHTPLHDGAVIIGEGRIKAAACFLPLSGQDNLGVEQGARHRAALGITEETDAVAIVVSEESGTISLSEGRSMMRGLDASSLAHALRERLGMHKGKRAPSQVPALDSAPPFRGGGTGAF